MSKFVTETAKIIEQLEKAVVNNPWAVALYFVFHPLEKISVPGLRFYVVFKKSCDGPEDVLTAVVKAVQNISDGPPVVCRDLMLIQTELFLYPLKLFFEFVKLFGSSPI